MSPKPRNKENRGLPQRWALKHGSYYYRPRDYEKPQFDNKCFFKLGKTYAEALRAFSERIDFDGDAATMRGLAEKYAIEVLAHKAPQTQKSQGRCMKRIVAVFEDAKVDAIESHKIYEYRNFIGKKHGHKSANLDLELLSHMFTKAIEWGVRRKMHPMTNKQVTKFTLAARDRYVEDWELEAFLSTASDFIYGYVLLKGLTGLDKGDLLSIRTSGIGKEGLTVSARKKTKTKRGTKRERFFPYVDPETGENTGIEEVLAKITSAKGRPDITPYLFCTVRGKDRGKPYIKEDGTTNGFDSIWQRAMKKALAETSLQESFTEHDLRAKVASDAETDEEAQRQMDHSSPNITRKVYRRKAIQMPVAKGFKGRR